VTTEVFPSEMGEAPIPWWVWVLAALGGLLLLALISYCLYKVSYVLCLYKVSFVLGLYKVSLDQSGKEE
jgi:RsiW-degrading membrane proteinase PrsW (M82 family)